MCFYAFHVKTQKQKRNKQEIQAKVIRMNFKNIWIFIFFKIGFGIKTLKLNFFKKS